MSTAIAPHLVWESVAAGIWIGRRDARFAGVIEARAGGDFIANDSVATVVYRTLLEAQAHFEG